MEALTISAANLSTIERNLGSVAKELSGVISNVNSVNSEIANVNNKVEGINGEIKSLVKEIRETTLITNARQSIMYNDTLIEKKFGYYNKVRRTVESLLDTINNNNLTKTSLITLKEHLLLNSPNYWLSNATMVLISWLLDDKESAYRELNNALKKDAKKTSLFFMLVNDVLNRKNTSINWLNKYLSLLNPEKLDKDFITVLDLVSSEGFNKDAKVLILNKINSWIPILNGKENITRKVTGLWNDFFRERQDNEVTIPMLDIYAKERKEIKANLSLTSTYNNVFYYLEEIAKENSKTKTKEEIIKELIYDYEKNEQTYTKDNFRNRLIIECSGDKEEADRLYKKEESIYNSESDLLTLLTNILIHKDRYNVNDNTVKLAISLLKPYILQSLNKIDTYLYKEPITLKINDFTTHSLNGTNYQEIKDDINTYLTKKYDKDDHDILIPIVVIDLIGIIGIFVTMKNQILCSIVIVLLILSNIFLISKLAKRTKIRNKEKENEKKYLTSLMDKLTAELIDVNKLSEGDLENKTKLINFLNNLNINDYLNNNERNIVIGG